MTIGDGSERLSKRVYFAGERLLSSSSPSISAAVAECFPPLCLEDPRKGREFPIALTCLFWSFLPWLAIDRAIGISLPLLSLAAGLYRPNSHVHRRGGHGVR